MKAVVTFLALLAASFAQADCGRLGYSRSFHGHRFHHKKFAYPIPVAVQAGYPVLIHQPVATAANFVQYVPYAQPQSIFVPQAIMPQSAYPVQQPYPQQPVYSQQAFFQQPCPNCPQAFPQPYPQQAYPQQPAYPQQAPVYPSKPSGYKLYAEDKYQPTNYQPTGGATKGAVLLSIVQRNCISCHSGRQPKGGLVLDDITRLSSFVREKMAQKVAAGEMPPSGPLTQPEIDLFQEFGATTDR